MAIFNPDLLNTSQNLREYLKNLSDKSTQPTGITLGSTPIYNVGSVWTGTEYAICYTSTDSGTDVTLQTLGSNKLTISY